MGSLTPMNKHKSTELHEQLVVSARQMRSAPTLAETQLWKHLRNKQLDGFKFRRQHIIHTFIVDFYCPAAKLVIEIDGEVHRQQGEYDHERNMFLESRGYRVLRFPNHQVLEDIESVLATIHTHLKAFR